MKKRLSDSTDESANPKETSATYADWLGWKGAGLQLPECVAAFHGNPKCADHDAAIKTFAVYLRYVVREIHITEECTKLSLNGIEGEWDSRMFSIYGPTHDIITPKPEPEIVPPPPEGAPEDCCYAVYHGKGGYDGERQSADEVFEKGRTYLVESILRGSFSSDITIQGIPRSWNSTLFSIYGNQDAVTEDSYRTNYIR